MRWLAISVSLLLASAFGAAARPNVNARKHASHSRSRTAHRAATRPVHSAARTRKAPPRRQTTASAKAPSKPASSSATSTKPAATKTAAKKRRRRRSRHFVLRQKAPTPTRISEIQSALARNGYYQGDPNGKWDHPTVAALEKFQTDNGLDSTGKLDARSLQKLGLGSDIAGMGAPQSPATISSPAVQGTISAPAKPASIAPPADLGSVTAPGASDKSSKPAQSGDQSQSAPASASKPADPTTPH